MARYIVRAKGAGGRVEFAEPLTIDQALAKVVELRKAHFEQITLFNIRTGLEITDLEDLLQGTEGT